MAANPSRALHRLNGRFNSIGGLRSVALRIPSFVPIERRRNYVGNLARQITQSVNRLDRVHSLLSVFFVAGGKVDYNVNLYVHASARPSTFRDILKEGRQPLAQWCVNRVSGKTIGDKLTFLGGEPLRAGVREHANRAAIEFIPVPNRNTEIR
jgi:hypothetical protein